MEFMDGLEGLEAIMSMDEQEEDTLALLRRQKRSLLDIKADLNAKDVLILSLQGRVNELSGCQEQVLELSSTVKGLQIVETENAGLKADMTHKVDQLAASHSECAHLQAQLSAATRRSKDLQSLVTTLQEEERDTKGQLHDAMHRVELIETLCERLNVEADKAKSNLQAERAERSALSVRTDDMHAAYEKAVKQQQAQLAELEETCRNYRHEQRDSKADLLKAQEDAERWRVRMVELDNAVKETQRRAIEDEEEAAAKVADLENTCLTLNEDLSLVSRANEDLASALREAGKYMNLVKELRDSVANCAAELQDSAEKEKDDEHNPDAQAGGGASDKGRSPTFMAPTKSAAAAAAALARKVELSIKQKAMQPPEKKWASVMSKNSVPSKGLKATTAIASTPATGNGNKPSSLMSRMPPKARSVHASTPPRAPANSLAHAQSPASSPAMPSTPYMYNNNSMSEALSDQSELLNRLRADLRACVRNIERSGLTNFDDSEVQLRTDAALPTILSLVVTLLSDSDTYYVQMARMHTRALQAEEQCSISVQEIVEHKNSIISLEEQISKNEIDRSREADAIVGLTDLLQSELYRLQQQLGYLETHEQVISTDTSTKIEAILKNAGLATLAALPPTPALAPTTRAAARLYQQQQEQKNKPSYQAIHSLSNVVGLTLTKMQVGYKVKVAHDQLKQELEQVTSVRDDALESADRARRHTEECKEEVARLVQGTQLIQNEYLLVQKEHALQVNALQSEAAAATEKLQGEIHAQIEDFVLQAAAFEQERELQEQKLNRLHRQMAQLAKLTLQENARCCDLSMQKSLLSQMVQKYDALKQDVTFLALSCVPRGAQRGNPGACSSKNAPGYEVVEFSPAVMHRLHRLSGTGGYGASSATAAYEYPTVGQATQRIGTSGTGGAGRRYALPSLRSIAIFIIAANRLKHILEWVRECRSGATTATATATGTATAAAATAAASGGGCKYDAVLQAGSKASQYGSFFAQEAPADSATVAHFPMERLSQMLQGRQAGSISKKHVSDKNAFSISKGTLMHALLSAHDIQSASLHSDSQGTSTPLRLTSSALYGPPTPATDQSTTLGGSAVGPSSRCRPLAAALPNNARSDVYGAQQVCVLERALIYMSSLLSELRQENSAFSQEYESLAQRQMEQATQLLMQEQLYQRQTPEEAIAMSASKPRAEDLHVSGNRHSASYVAAHPNGHTPGVHEHHLPPQHRAAGGHATYDANGHLMQYHGHPPSHSQAHSAEHEAVKHHLHAHNTQIVSNEHGKMEHPSSGGSNSAGGGDGTKYSSISESYAEAALAAANAEQYGAALRPGEEEDGEEEEEVAEEEGEEDENRIALERASAAVARLAGLVDARSSVSDNAGSVDQSTNDPYTPMITTPSTGTKVAWTQGSYSYSGSVPERSFSPPMSRHQAQHSQSHTGESNYHMTDPYTRASARSVELERLRSRLQAPLDVLGSNYRGPAHGHNMSTSMNSGNSNINSSIHSSRDSGSHTQRHSRGN